MANKKSSIEIQLTARDISLGTIIGKGRAAVKAFNAEVGGSSSSIASMRSQVVQLAGAFAGLSAIADVGAMLKQADQNAYGLAASIQAANREFAVGTASEWEATIAGISQKLRVYSQSDIRGATAATIDMTKRLGLNAEQMRRVIELSGDLAVGRTDIAGAVERVTAALRGEAEASEYLGLTLNETYVKGWYEAHGAMQGAWKDLNDLQKAQVRYNVFLEQAIPLQGKASASVNTYSGALQLIRSTVADNISTNADLVSALADVGSILRENAGDIGSFAGQLARGAAAVISFVAANRELLIDVAKYGAIFALGSSAVLRLMETVRGLNAAFAAMTGMGVVQWMQQVLAAGNSATAGLLLLRTAFISLSVAASVFFAAYKAGEWITMRSAIEGTAQAQAELERTTKKVDQEFRKISESTGVVVTSMEELDRAVKDGRIHYDQLTGAWVAGAATQAAATKQAAGAMKQATGDALKEMEKQYQEYAAKIRSLQEQIAGRERSLAAELREMSRSGMSEPSAWEDRKREADEYAKAARDAAATARAAFETGDTITADQLFKEALQFADEAKRAYSSLNTEVRSGDQVLIDKQQALKTAMEGVKEAGQVGIEILQAQQQAAKEAMNALVEGSGFANLEKGMDAAEQKWLENWRKMQEASVEHIEVVKKRIDALVEDRHVTVWVEEKIKRATGGPVGLARGGKLPGYGGGDRISALLEAGEYVIRKEAVSKFGPAVFHALNNLRLPELPKFAIGGPVGFATGGPAAPSEVHALDITLGGAYAGRLTGAPVDVKKIRSAFDRAQRLRS